MNIYLIKQSENTAYDTYDSAVVCAENAKEARLTHPCEWDKKKYVDGNWINESGHVANYDWTNQVYKISVQLIGVAAYGQDKGVICSSFNAG